MRLIFPISTLSAAAGATVRLPVLKAPDRKLHILLVDDDPGLIDSLRRTLEDDWHEVSCACGGQAGIEAFRAVQKTRPFDVVITDLGMPYVDGRQVVQAVRSVEPRMPIILLTGWGQQLSAENELPPKVDRLMSKPPRLRELRTALAELTS